jgi:hypothetical protein
MNFYEILIYSENTHIVHPKLHRKASTLIDMSPSTFNRFVKNPDLSFSDFSENSQTTFTGIALFVFLLQVPIKFFKSVLYFVLELYIF